MSQTTFEETFDKALGFGSAALLIVGAVHVLPKAGAWLWENGEKLLIGTGNALAQIQAKDPDAFNKMFNTTPRPTPAPHSVSTPVLRICDKCGKFSGPVCTSIQCAPHLYSYCATHARHYFRDRRCWVCFPSPRKSRRSRRNTSLKAKAAKPAELLPAPLKQIAGPRAVETLAPLTVKKRVDEKAQNHKGGREPGSSNKKTRMYLRDYNKCLEAGDSEKDAIDKVTKKHCPTARHSKDFRRSLVVLVKKHLGGADKK
jgi:hypothetical protein